LHFTVSDAQAAARNLNTRFGIRNFEIQTLNELAMPGAGVDTGTVIQQFVQGGLSVSDAHLCETPWRTTSSGLLEVRPPLYK